MYVNPASNIGNFMSWKLLKSGLSFHKAQVSMEHRIPIPADRGTKSLSKKPLINGMMMFWVMHWLERMFSIELKDLMIGRMMVWPAIGISSTIVTTITTIQARIQSANVNHEENQNMYSLAYRSTLDVFLARNFAIPVILYRGGLISDDQSKIEILL